MKRNPSSEAKKIKENEKKRESLNALVRAVREDAQTAPSRFLKETIVPEGGE